MSARECWIMQDRQERFNSKRAWFVNAYRIVDGDGNDLVQPWCDSRKEARELAGQLGYVLRGEYTPIKAASVAGGWHE